MQGCRAEMSTKNYVLEVFPTVTDNRHVYQANDNFMQQLLKDHSLKFVISQVESLASEYILRINDEDLKS